MHDRYVGAVDQQRPRLDGDVVDRAFFQRSHRIEIATAKLEQAHRDPGATGGGGA